MSVMFHVKTSSDGQYYFLLADQDGNTLLQSERYTQKASCLSGIDSVKNHCADDQNYQRAVARDGSHYCNLHASNGQVVATSLMHAEPASLEAVIKQCKQAQNAAVEAP